MGKYLHLPFAVTVYCISAHHEDFGSKLLKRGIFDSNCRQFCRSDYGKIANVEKKYYPFSPVLREMNF
jgi:hypothetical protein